MRLSEERVDAIAMAIVDRLCEDELIDLEIEEENLADLVSEVLLKDLRREEEVQKEAVDFLKKTKPQLEPGSSGWSIELDRVRDRIAVKRGYVLP